MRILPAIFLASALASALEANSASARAAEYFVAKHGDNAHTGTDRAAAWATIQKGLDALQPGDTLTISPGEYFEGVKRTGLGSAERDTVIRAEIPGTVLLRGDVPAPVFRPCAGHRFVYEADFDAAAEVPAVNEIDTLTILKRMPNRTELEFIPGTFFHDPAARKLYVATSDLRPPETHHYSVSVIPTHGVLLVNPQRVVIEGLAMTGFNAMQIVHYREATAGGVWGLFLVSPARCVVRDCRAYLNGWGMALNSGAPGSGENVFERCAAWGNKSIYANGDMGGLTLFGARRDVIRDSVAYRNGIYGINIYGTGGAPPNGNDGGNDPEKRSLLTRNLAWGNETADLKVKTGYEYYHVVENCVGLGLWSATHITHGLIGSARNQDLADCISFAPGMDVDREFADPVHHDYRLQATSAFRGAAPEGQDRGPFPYQPNIFYVRPGGDDQGDGLSVAGAWKTLARAVGGLRAGDTLYLEPGLYDTGPGLDLRAVGTQAAPVFIRGRGRGPALLRGVIRASGSSWVAFERLSFLDSVQLNRSSEVAFDNCEFRAGGTALEVSGVEGLKVSHCVFRGFQRATLALASSSRVDLSGNLFDNAHGVALRIAGEETVRYANYNSYHKANAAWEIDGRFRAWSDLLPTHEQQSQELAPEWSLEEAEGGACLINPARFAARGPLGKPIGRFEDEPRWEELRLAATPVVHSVSATTANLEWMTSLPATCHLAWGETPACDEHAVEFNVNYFGTYSLTGLTPGKTYYFRIKSLETPKDMLPKTTVQSVPCTGDPLPFTTLAQDRPPAIYTVAPEGDDTQSGLDRPHAWRTIGHAAAQVNVGDTVLIARGKYAERVRLRATGAPGLPITFQALPGERVDLDGGNGVLPNAFVAGGKSHLRFDGFYLANFNLFPNDSWGLSNSGEFQLYAGRDMAISRCFSEGRGGYSAAPVSAFQIENLTVKNCVNTYKFGGMYFWRCPNLVIENTVFAEPMIMSFVLRNEKDQAATMAHCIFTDMLEKKAKLNIGLLCCDGPIDAFHQHNNAYFLRCFPPEERALNGDKPIGQLGDHIHTPLFADPQFAGDPGVKGHPEDKSGFAPDRMMESSLKLDFDSFFSTNPDLIQRGIGLQPEAFRDYPFAKPAAR